VALCLASAFGFGCMAIFAKDAYKQHLGITALLSLRFALAALIFWTIARLRGPISLPPRRTLLAALGLGAIGYAAQSGLFFGAVRRMDASTTSLLLYTYPAMVFLAALALRREHADRRRLGALALGCDGAALTRALTTWSDDVVLFTHGSAVTEPDRVALDARAIAVVDGRTKQTTLFVKA
jgi:drug/metabolite transporter (DMT)-like permease